MYAENFLTMCPACRTVTTSPRAHLHSEVTCFRCSSRFTAEENYLDLDDDDDDDNYGMPVPQLEPVSVANTNLKQLSDEQTAASKTGGLIDLRNRISSRKEEYNLKPLEWRLEKIESITAGDEPDTSKTKDNVKENPAATVANVDNVVPVKQACSHLESDSMVTGKDLGFYPKFDGPMTGKEARYSSLESKMVQDVSKWKKRDYSQSFTRRVAQKNHRKWQVKCHSSSMAGTRKKVKLELRNVKKLRKYIRIHMKTYKREEKANGDQNRWSQGHNCVNQGCNKVNTKISLVSKLSSEQYLELTEVLAGEINRQLLEGLDEVSRKIMGDIQVVGVEDLLPVTSDNTLNTQNSMPEEQRFMAKVKLMATVLFPITLRSNQGCATRFPGGSKIRHDSEDIAEGKVRAGELEVSNMPECQQDSEKPSCKPLFKDGHESTAMEPEVNELMETAGKSVNELYLEDDFDTPKDMEVSKQSPLETEKPSAGPRSNCMYEEVDVPESEFYDFECNRSEDNFASGQIWALYDSGKDMMPRDYVEIKRVLGTQPFSVHISLLLPCGLSCGRFNVENRVRESCEINGFSHLMSCRKGPDGSIHIYPSVGEVWALYKNWQLPHPYMFGYDIVQVVFVGKDLTISVIPLANERGSRTVYIKSEAQPFQIDEYALARFSHQIPMYEIIPFDGMEGRLELDPAAIPC